MQRLTFLNHVSSISLTEILSFCGCSLFDLSNPDCHLRAKQQVFFGLNKLSSKN